MYIQGETLLKGKPVDGAIHLPVLVFVMRKNGEATTSLWDMEHTLAERVMFLQGELG
jgi:hypothetical protein